MQIPPVPADQPTRYLGVPVSAAPAVSAAWTATMRAIQVCVLLALQKTADVLQRCKLAAAIIVPKSLFVARNVCLTADTVERLDRAMHNFVWTGHFAGECGSGRKALLNRYHSQLRQADGGVGEPNIRAELRTMATSTVATWAHGWAREAQAIGDVFIWRLGHGSTPQTTWITPGLPGGSAPTWKLSLWIMAPAYSSIRTEALGTHSKSMASRVCSSRLCACDTKGPGEMASGAATSRPSTPDFDYSVKSNAIVMATRICAGFRCRD